MSRISRKCFAPGCTTGYKSNKERLSLFKAPKDDNLREKWAKVIARPDRQLSERDALCERHFNPEDIFRKEIINNMVFEYKRPRLKPFSIPVPLTSCPPYLNSRSINTRKITTNINTQVCCVPGCYNRTFQKNKEQEQKEGKVSFHRFPKDPAKLQQWLQFLNKPDWLPTHYTLICSEHFLEKYIDRTSTINIRLRENAVPTIFKHGNRFVKSNEFITPIATTNLNIPNQDLLVPYKAVPTDPTDHSNIETVDSNTPLKTFAAKDSDLDIIEPNFPFISCNNINTTIKFESTCVDLSNSNERISEDLLDSDAEIVEPSNPFLFCDVNSDPRVSESEHNSENSIDSLKNISCGHDCCAVAPEKIKHYKQKIKMLQQKVCRQSKTIESLTNELRKKN